MNHRSSTPLLALILGLVGLVGCQGPSNITTKGKVMVDTGGDETRDGGNNGAVSDLVDEVWLRIDEVSVRHETEGWVFIDNGRVNLNLMEKRDGAIESIGDGDVFEGDCDKLRLTIEDAWIIVDGVELDLDIDNGIDLNNSVDFDVAIAVNESTQAVVWVGWDLDNTLSVSGGEWSLDTDVNLSVDVDSL